ncbi:MAG: LamG domain-containing protein [Phycisphaerae bacterium]|nr:LamG domain-containing protein [Phycisphaerae bacterium]
MCGKLIRLISAVLVLGVAGNTSAELVGHWKLDGNLDDSAGSANATFTGGTPGYGAGMDNQGLVFDGADDYMELPLATSPTTYTIAAWVKPARTDAASIIARTSSSGPTTHWSHQLRINSSGLFEHYTYDGSARTVAGTTAIEVDTWYFVAVTATNNGDMRLYVNGQEEGTATTVGTLWAAGDRYHVGSNSGNAMGWLEGMVDDIRIYDHILSEVEILSAMAGEVWPYAWGPNPADGAMLGATWVNLGWSPGGHAVSHDVYLSDNFDDVNSGAEGAFQGNLGTTSLIAGFTGFAFPDGLVPGTTYYWRVDEVNDSEPNSPWKGDVWSFWVPPKKAYEAVPADKARFVLSDVILEWTAGFNAKLHTVYFSDNFDEVDNASGGVAQTGTTFTPGVLESDKTYYWRVDEFDPPATHKGDVWSFTTLPEVEITDPSLIGWWKLDEGAGTTVVDWSGHGNHGTLRNGPQWALDGYNGGATEFDGKDDYVSVMLDASETEYAAAMWFRTTNANCGLMTVVQNDLGGGGHDRHIYLSAGNLMARVWDDETIATGVNLADGLWHHVVHTYGGSAGGQKLYVDGVLQASGTKAQSDFDWQERVNIGFSNDAAQDYFEGLLDDVHIYDKTLSEEEIGALIRGDTKSAGSPVPARHATVDIRDISSLSWSKGDTAASHDVYFGTDRDAVAGADNSSPAFKGNQAGTSLSLAGLVEFGGGDYYWRVDEVEAGGTVIAGTIWKFTVPGHLIVDNFESYNDLNENEPGSNRIYLTWIDGFGTLTNGAVAGNLDPPFMSQGRSSAQAMPVSYDNAGKTSEATMTLVSKKDWTEHGVTKLVVWFKGDSANAPDRMFAALGNAVVYHPDDAATQDGGWNEWVIDLQEFATQGANLTNVGSITIGFGTRGAPVATGGIGTVHFDDIRLIR